MENDKEHTVERAVIATAFVAGLVLAALIVTYFVWFKYQGADLATESAAWGTFGDFVGGIGNPIVSLATLVIVALA